jgi:iron(III) transport system ATP-binding protein
VDTYAPDHHVQPSSRASRDDVILLEGVSKRFPNGVLAVDRLWLRISAGDMVVLLGPSGSGKTTALRLIAGFERPDEGEIHIAGRLVASAPDYVPPERRGVGMVFQDYALFPHLSVSGNIAFGLRAGEWTEAQRRSRVAELLDLVGLTSMGRRYPHQLSGGQQQRVALARALAPRPSVVLLDEPFSNLDTALRARVRTEVREILRAARATAVFVTHDQEEALSVADQVAVMWAGRVLQMASPEELYARPATREVAAFVGEANFLRGVAEDGIVQCELGPVHVANAPQGEVELLLRPEFVLPIPDESGTGLVVDREFYGHDALFTLRLDSGTALRSLVGRRRQESALRPGQRVRVEVNGEGVAFPVASG